MARTSSAVKHVPQVYLPRGAVHISVNKTFFNQDFLVLGLVFLTRILESGLEFYRGELLKCKNNNS